MLRCYPGNRRSTAWRDWRESGDLADVDRGSFRLLPLLYRNLIRHNIDDPQLPRLRGVYRQAWYRNQLAMERAHEAARILTAAGIPVMALKGAALIDGVYGELGARPMDDVDLMVPRRSATKALLILGEAGWSSPTHRSGDFRRALRIVHGVPLARANGLTIDLHWRLLDESNAGDAAFWEAAEPLPFGNSPVVRLCPADQLLHLSVHGIRWDPVPPIRWAADIYLLLERRGADVDWERLVDQALKGGLSLELLAALSYVSGQLGASVPPDVLRRLRDAKPSRLAYMDFRAPGRPYDGPIAGRPVRHAICAALGRPAAASETKRRTVLPAGIMGP